MLHDMPAKMRYVVYEQDGAFIAQCLDVDVASEGDTEDGAVAALAEALALYFDGTTPPSANPQAMRFGEIAVHA